MPVVAVQEEWPLLVIVPASLRLVWAEEIERWLPHVRPGDVTVIEGKDDRSDGAGRMGGMDRPQAQRG